MARKIQKRSNSYRYKNLTFLLLSIVLAVVLFKNESFHLYLLRLGTLEYVGAFIAGYFFTSTFTIAPASIVLYILAESLPIWSVGLVAAVGATLGDLTIFQFFHSNETAKEILLLFNSMGGKSILHFIHSKHLRWTMPVIGALIIMSPLPDELGVSLMGISKLKTSYFLVLSYVLNLAAVFLLLSVSAFIKP